MKNFRTISLLLSLCLFFITQMGFAQCFPPGTVVTATKATGGTSPYKEEVLWLTWGSSDDTANPYGKEGVSIVDGDVSRASILLNNGDYLCVEAEIISGEWEICFDWSTFEFYDCWQPTDPNIDSYIPGTYIGDSMDELYNIGGTGSNNQLVTGFRTANATTTEFMVVCKASINGNPVKLAGAVVADAESLSSGEYITATAEGRWTVTEVQKNSGAGSYDISKSNNGAEQSIFFERGNNDNTAAITFLSFSESAYGTVADDYEVSFTVEMRGVGKTAAALGLLLPATDLGDAPKTYGDPVHRLNGVSFSSDHIPENGTSVNINTVSYQPAGLAPGSDGHLGNAGPDAESTQIYSNDAKGDDSVGNANEEDAWSLPYITKAAYTPGQSLAVTIPYNSIDDAWISGWIDFNLNGKFENDEIATKEALAVNSSVTLTWTVPNERLLKNTYVRLRYAENLSDVQAPTGLAIGGEVEDFYIPIEHFVISNPVLRSRVQGDTTY